MGIFKRIFGQKPDVSVDSVSFDTAGYQSKGGDAEKRVWFTPGGDGVGLFFFPKPPDLPANAQTIDELREFYTKLIGDRGMKIVELRVQTVAGVDCVWVVLKSPRKPHGIDYVGSLTIPFADLSFVIKMQCQEGNITGMREAALLVMTQQEGTVTLTPEGKISGDWNPDDERYDAKFPNHPVSRLRREFGRIIATLRIEDAARNRARFKLPNGTV
jgi:hypothetical protein